MLILIVDEQGAGTSAVSDLAKSRPGVTVLKSPESRSAARAAAAPVAGASPEGGSGGDGSGNVVAFRPPATPVVGPTTGLTEIVEEVEARLVHEAMAKTGNNQIRAAELLQITRGALQYKLKKYARQAQAA